MSIGSGSGKKRGRPAGSPNNPSPIVVCALPNCPRRGCGSTDREVLRKVRERVAPGMHDGQPYNRTVWRRVRCLACRQVYVLISYELAPEENNQDPE